MESATLTQIASLFGLLGAGIAFMFSKQTVEALITFGNWWIDARAKRLEFESKLQHQRFEEDQQRESFKREQDERQLRQLAFDEELNDKGHKWIIRRQDQRITILETSEKKCREDFAILETKYRIIEAELSRTGTDLRVLRQRLELLAPGVSDVSDSKVARYFQRLAKLRDRHKLEHESSGEIDLDSENKQ
jgi:hypothetical protein